MPPDASAMSNVATPQPLRRLRAGIVGGGRGAFIGSVHRIAAELDGQAQIVAGAMSSHPEIARESAAAWFLERTYTSYADMASSEAADESGIDFVIIATPNEDRKSTRLNSSHSQISYAVFCLKKKNN